MSNLKKRQQQKVPFKNAVEGNSSSFSAFGVPLMISETDFSVAGLGLWHNWVIWCAPVSTPSPSINGAPHCQFHLQGKGNN